MPGVNLQFMQSSGGLTDAHRFQGKDAILSGPAGGIVGLARTGQVAGFGRLIGFDMGGTSTDVSHFAGEFEREFETQVAGVRMRAPMMSIHTVAAGGGSILHFDGTRLRVGPDSAGANPGPASYGRGGPLTVTDCNVMLGKIQPAFFPRVLGLHADQPLDADVVREKFTALAEEIFQATGNRRTPEQVAEGFIEIAVGNMTNAIKQISVQRGHDVTGYVLPPFGGAGGQPACLMADGLGMRRVFAHPLAGVLSSAYGIGLANQSVMREESVELVLSDDALPELAARLYKLAQHGTTELLQQGVAASRIETLRHVHLRYHGTDNALIVPFGDVATMRAAFEAAYRQRYAFLMPDKALVAEAISVEVLGVSDAPQESFAELPARTGALQPADTVRMFSGGEWRDTSLFRRENTRPGDIIRGPAIIAEPVATTVVDAGWQAEVTPLNHLVLTRIEKLRYAAQSVQCRSGHARGVQQPVHEHCRADGAAPPDWRHRTAQASVVARCATDRQRGRSMESPFRVRAARAPGQRSAGVRRRWRARPGAAHVARCTPGSRRCRRAGCRMGIVGCLATDRGDRDRGPNCRRFAWR